jgi:hypothetical protein
MCSPFIGLVFNPDFSFVDNFILPWGISTLEAGLEKEESIQSLSL